MSFAPDAAEAATDALLQAIVKSERVAATFSAVCDGGSLTTWREPGRSLLGPSSSGPITDPVGTRYWAKLHRLGEGIFADEGLDALDEANMHVVQMDPRHSDWRAMVLESVWFDIGRAA
ncbi:hypothetical protein [Methylobacterium oxalidis]|uniref:hypothetical protein n=1 Tax=Methylobacterium oxalidis TaxID=944322 RepID=UPI003315F890